MSVYADALSPHFPVRPEWLAQHEEPVLEPDLAIIDCHHHLWDRPEGAYLFDDLLADISTGHRIISTVYMECGVMYRANEPEHEKSLGETQFANGAAAMSASGQYGDTKVCAGIIGSVDLRLGDMATPLLEQHIKNGGGRFRGVRQIAAWHDDPNARGSLASPPKGLFGDDTFRQGVRALTPLNLTLDTYLYHTQIDELIDLATTCPDTTIILNHVGGPIGIGPYQGQRDAVFAAWRRDMTTLAKCDNVRVKIGGMGMRVFGYGFGDQPTPPSSSQLASAWSPTIQTCIELFGPSRCMFESNFPVDKGSCSYRVIWNAFKRSVTDASESEKQQLFELTATQTYRL